MHKRDAILWIAITVAPLAWFADLVVSWALTPPAYRGGDPTWLHVVSGLALAVTISAGVAAWLQLRTLPPDGDRAEGRARFMAIAAIVIALGACLLVLATAVPKWILPPGAEP